MTQPSVVIHACGTHLPKQIVRSDEIFDDIKSEKNYGIPNDWMEKTMGISERRMVAPGTKPSSLAIAAAKRAIEQAGDIPLDEIGMVLFCGIERDRPEPATAHTVQDALGLKANIAFDIANACYGFIDGMQIAESYIRAGLCKYVLVTTGEIPTKLITAFGEKLKKGLDRSAASKLLGFLSVGDAGGAVIMGPSEHKGSGFNVFNNSAASIHKNKCYYETSDEGEIVGAMDMARIVHYGFRMQKAIITETLKKNGWTNFDWLLSHQTGKKNFDQIVDLECVDPDKAIKTYPLLGNITSATFPINYEKLISRTGLKRGDRIGGVFGGSGLVVGQFGYTY